MKFANPTNDIAFKKIFGDENKTEVLISFLNSILDFQGNKKIKSVTIANPYQVPKIKELKNTILDIKATNQDNEQFIVEMQVEKDREFAKRSLYYTSKSYVEQIDKAENYRKLKKVYFIGILNFAILDTKEYISRHLILDEKTLKQEVADFEFTFIELKKFNLTLQECDTNAKKWIYFIQNASSFDMIPKEYEDIEAFVTAFESAKQYNWSKKEMEVYDWHFKQTWKQLSVIETALEDGKEMGIKVGREEGLKEGLKEGLREGLKEGEQNKAIEIAKNLLDVLDDETIATKTGLSVEEIEKLR